ncbi:MarR family transcriptional regulator [Pullulanibacillus sp. KACC 23026]|uniref:MarR family winged helix-turn-helix transcriptional regulator n=1 Tax=Pullulanibacillus sp. KACC 23026 TaxID=3028315 RepID=UPI0023AFBDD4|nr:MarR family transcriptional regulator [Pullulanibacillus sp. KACC 23026]WEG11853.1 MarR family transcriptional regulator [Pullulanibacillus sp. KACC 23026]
MEEKVALIQSIEQRYRMMFRQIQKELNDLFRGENITSHELVFLKQISIEEPVKISDLSKELSVTPSYATALSDRLLQRGYIERKRSEVDRRIVELTSTDQGKALVVELDNKKSQFFLKLYSHFSIEELKILDILIGKFEKATYPE